MTATTTTSNRIDRADYGFSIRPEGGAWFGYEWERTTCLAVRSECVAGPFTETEARAWLAA